MAYDGENNINMPYPEIDGFDFSFSGIKTHIINLEHNSKMKNTILKKEDIAASFQDIIVRILYDKTKKALDETGYKSLVIARWSFGQ